MVYVMKFSSLVFPVFLSLGILLSGCAVVTYAQTESTSNTPVLTPQAQLRSQKAEQIKADMQQKVVQRKENLETRMASKEAAIKERTDKRIARVDTRIASKEAAMKERVENRVKRFEERSELRKERIATKEAALKEKLDRFKNKEKATVAERVSTNLNQMNENRIKIMKANLEKMSEILDRLESKIAEADKLLSSDSQSSIAKAREDITAAQLLVDAQLEKDYTITVTTESMIKSDASVARTNLSTDLKNAHTAVVAARQSVAAAISSVVSSLGGVGNGQ